MAEAKLLAEEIVKALDSKRAKEIEVLRVGDITILADYFILCTATSTTQTPLWWCIFSCRSSGNSTSWIGCGRTERQ